MPMKILFCGLGSIGQRHIQNLCRVLDERGIPRDIRAVRSTKRPLPDDITKLVSAGYGSLDEAGGGYDLAFVTNPTSLHAATLRRLSGRAKAVFVEKPVLDDPGIVLASLGLDRSAVYYVACPLRYHPVVRRMKELAGQHRVVAARAICSSYLPDWRPGVDYRQCYSAHRAEGGGVALDLIHEWDYLSWLFGSPLEVRMMAGHLSVLEIDSDDVAVYIARFGDMLLSLQLDYIGRTPERGLAMYCQDEVITGDILAGTVTHAAAGTTEQLPKTDVHLDEMSYFIDCALENRADNINTIEHALAVLRLATEGR